MSHFSPQDEDLAHLQDDIASLKVEFTEKDTSNIEKWLRKTYDQVAQEGILDVTYFKYLMHKADLHLTNPALFREINNRAK